MPFEQVGVRNSGRLLVSPGSGLQEKPWRWLYESVFKRKPAPDLIRGGNRFAPRKRVKSRIQSPASIPSKRGPADPQSINRTSDGMACASHAGVHASLNYAAAAVALVRKAGGVRVI